MTLLADYRRNYDKIAADHVDYWRRTRRNPFQDPRALRENEDATFGNLTRYVASGRVLDAGCGIGDLLSRLGNYDALGVDIAKPYLDVARERGLNVRYARIEKLPYASGTFDGVVAADVLEHVIDIHSVAKELVRVLRPGGYLVVRTPNDETIDCDWDGGYEFIHLRTLDEGTLCILFSRLLGCEMVEAFSNDQVIHMVVRK